MIILWRHGELVAPGDPAFRADDPAVHGLGLFETMRADGGQVAWLDRHLERMTVSANVLGLRPFPTKSEIESAVDEVLSAAGPESLRVRVTASAGPTLVVEASGAPSASLDDGARAVSLPGTWHPSRRLAEHKTTSHGQYLLAQRTAEEEGADHALLLDAEGRLGEAAIANAFCVRDGVILTAPARGLLPGIARAEVMRLRAVEERAPEEAEWRGASELFVTNALRGVVPLLSVDGVPVGDGAVGSVARELARELPTSTG